jgi:pimeloyl-ACP methyl ester carboxylesterase
MKNNSLKMLSDSLLSHGIASLCYDKRGIAESVAAGSDESALRFENYIDDAVAWIEKLKSDNRYNKIIVIGHSEGSLIGMIAAARANADGFISMAGAGFKAGDILKTQLAAQPEAIKNACYSAIDSLEAGKTVSEVNPMLYSLFRPSVQPYLISWFKYDPRVEIRKISKPVLILQGTTDIQVSVQDAENLKEALPTATLSIIDGMNHILKDAPADRQANIATYSEPDLPIDKELIKDIVDFIKNLQ